MDKFIPLKLIEYLVIEYLKCFLIVLTIFISISLLTNFVEEIIFFKEKEINNLLLRSVYLTFLKTTNTLIETSIFIILFSGILFFVKFRKNSEINTIKLSGISNLLPIFCASFSAFFIGILIIALISPISSQGIKIYEKNKRLFSQNDNLIVINDSGLWFMENNNSNYRIIRADKIANNDFSKLYNSTIYELDNDFNFLKRFDSKIIFINKKNWFLENVSILENNIDNKNRESKDIKIKSSININELKNLFTNVNTISFWEILKNIKILNQRGYSGDELKVKFHKYLSLPIYLFTMIILSTIFTINLKKDYSVFLYIFFGIIFGILVYFLNDLSIALGFSNKLPLAVSVWIPIIIILAISILNLININEN